MKTFSFITVAVLGVVGASAQTAQDPYNPQTRRNPATLTAAGNSANIQPSLADMGFGTDEGNNGPFVTLTDKQYARSMAARGIMEIQLGQAALEKSDRSDVKAVAHRMIEDYLKWDAGMEKAAQKLGIPLPTQLDEKEKAEVDHICALSGSAFDQAYLKEVVRLQTKALTMSHHEASEAAVSGFRHWAGVVIPDLQDQVNFAQNTLALKTIAAK
jgi:putative membrane protein